MGAWGTRSCDCDDVQDELDNRFNNRGANAYSAAAIERELSHVKGDTYNPTRLVGVVDGVLEMGEVSVRHLIRAVNEAKAALKDEAYLKTWRKKADRIKDLKKEIRSFQRLIKKGTKP